MINIAAEKNFENRIKRYLKEKGIYHFKTFGNAYQRSGLADIICCVNGYFLGIEVKAENGRPSDLQLYEQRQVEASNGISLIVKPSDFEYLKTVINELLERKHT